MTESQFQPTLKTVRVAKNSLLAKLKENRSKHIQDYKTALEGYHLEVERLVHEASTNLKQDKTFYATGLFIHESPPEDHTKEYDKVIATLELSLDDQFYLTEQDINCYILDNWSWKQNFAATTSKYFSNVAGKL